MVFVGVELHPWVSRAPSSRGSVTGVSEKPEAKTVQRFGATFRPGPSLRQARCWSTVCGFPVAAWAQARKPDRQSPASQELSTRGQKVKSNQEKPREQTPLSQMSHPGSGHAHAARGPVLRCA